MKKLITIVTVLILSSNSYAQRNQKFKLFGEKISAKEVTGINKFNDLGTFSHTSVIRDLTDDLNAFLLRLGTVRYNQNNYYQGVYSLFDLSNYASPGSYPILESIDNKYYEEVGFLLLEKKDTSLINNTAYLNFKNSFKQANNNEKSTMLWSDENHKFRDSLINTKYYINIQRIKNNVTKKLKRAITDSLNIDFKSIVDKIPSDKLDTNNKAKLTTYLNNVNEKKQDILLEGFYVSAIFNTRYISIADFVIRGLKKEALDTINNEFDYNLNKYISNNIHNKNKKTQKHALNSAVYGFKFSGSYELIKIDSFELESILDISADLRVEIANKINFEIEKTYNRTFKNEFNKLWIIMFATDGVLYNLNIEKRN